MIRPYSVQIPEPQLEDLKIRLTNTRWPDEITGSEWTYGANLDYMKELADYWLHTFNWRTVEEEINAYPNFIAHIDGYDIHFLHIRGAGTSAVPLIITHGWPGSFLEMMKLIPLLTREEGISFDLVIPSVIGFGFSGKASEPGCNSAFVAGLWHKLMGELGYERYGAQGGDIGSGISTWLALRHPESVLGLHLNYISGSFQPYPAADEALPEEVNEYERRAGDWAAREGAYAHQHATKPITLAYGLNDSPVGLGAWIIEKFQGWSDSHGDLESVFTKDELLANVTLYWLTRTIHSSIRMYNENSKHPLQLAKGEFVRVPVGFAKFPKELPTPPRTYVERGFNIQRWTEMSSGGHFAAVEQPELLARDIREFFGGLSQLPLVTN